MFAPPRDKFNRTKSSKNKIEISSAQNNQGHNYLTTTKLYPASGRVRRSSYRTKSRTSEVDETLFGSPNRYQQQKARKHSEDASTWNPPWDKDNETKNSTGGYLVWSPERPGSSTSRSTTARSVASTRPLHLNNSEDLNVVSPRSKIHLEQSTVESPRRPMSSRSNKYRLRKHTETYIDESLFGNKEDFGTNISYKDRYERKEKIPFMANSAWTSPLK